MNDIKGLFWNKYLDNYFYKIKLYILILKYNFEFMLAKLNHKKL